MLEISWCHRICRPVACLLLKQVRILDTTTQPCHFGYQDLYSSLPFKGKNKFVTFGYQDLYSSLPFKGKNKFVTFGYQDLYSSLPFKGKNKFVTFGYQDLYSSLPFKGKNRFVTFFLTGESQIVSSLRD